MFGALTFLPLFMQNVKGVSPTASGLRILPVMLGMLAASVTSGRLVTRWGRYKIFPVLGTAMMTVGAFLLSMIDVVDEQLGAGPVHVRLRRRHGSHHAGARGRGPERRFLRGSRSRHQLGDLLPHDRRLLRHRGLRRDLRHRLHAHVRAGAGPGLPAVLRSFNPQTIDPAVLERLKSTAAGLAFYTRYIDAVTHAIQTVFLVAVPISFVAFLLASCCPRCRCARPSRRSTWAKSTGCPSTGRRLQEIELALDPVLRSGEPGRAVPARWPSGPGSTCRPGRAGSSTGWPRTRPARSRIWPSG